MGSSQTTTDEVWRRWETDAAFRERAAADLPGALRELGLPDDAIGRFRLGAPEATDEVQGHAMDRWLCLIEGDKTQCVNLNPDVYRP